jgi:hypothetical protein
VTLGEAQEIYQTYLEAVRCNPENEELAEDLVKAWSQRDTIFYQTKLAALDAEDCCSGCTVHGSAYAAATRKDAVDGTR